MMARYMFIDTTINTRITIIEAEDEKNAKLNFREGLNVISTTETENTTSDIKVMDDSRFILDIETGNKPLKDCDRDKLKEGFEESFSPSYSNGFATALILLGVDKDEIEYITGKSIEYWKV